MKSFYKNYGPYSIGEISSATNCCFIDDKVNSNILINDIKTLEEAHENSLTILHNLSNSYLQKFINTKAKACIVPKSLLDSDFSKKIPANLVLMISAEPYLSYKKAIDLFYNPSNQKQQKTKISNLASIHPTAKIGNNVVISDYAVIEEYTEIGEYSYISPSCYIGRSVKIGAGSKLAAGVSVEYAIIGNNVNILPGAKIGNDGFGFATSGGVHHKIFHNGLVIIGNNVEIGANTTIDRGSNFSNTIIGDNTIIDNLVQIAHNVKIGKACVIVAQTGIAGSTVIGDYCVLGGQVGVAGHLKIANYVQIAAKSGVIKNIDEPRSIMGGIPATKINQWHRQNIIIQNLAKNKKDI